MRAKEFTINVPINIRLGDDDEPEITTPDTTNIVRDVPLKSHDDPKSSETDHEEGESDVMVPPLQQQIELQKATQGKESEVIDDLVDEDDIDREHREEQEEEDEDAKLLDLTSFWKQRPVGE